MCFGESRTKRLLKVLICSLGVAGCTPTTMLSVGEQPEEVLRYVEVGNHVRVFTSSGETYEFQVTELTRFAISGEEQEVPFDEIANVEVRIRQEPMVDPVGDAIGIWQLVGSIALALGAITMAGQ